MSDFRITFPLDFFATEVTVEPTSDAGCKLFGEMFGCAGIAPTSITMPKSRAEDFGLFVEQKGLAFSTDTRRA